MDVDEIQEERDLSGRQDMTFANTEELTATFYAHLPVEVKKALKGTDLREQSYSGDIDTLTGFAIVASREICFVWKHAQALTGTPTCYIFLCPQAENGREDIMTTPFYALIPHGPTREPGLIISSHIGQIRFWDGVGMGLAGGDNFTYYNLSLDQGELVTTLSRADPRTYIISTSKGRLFRLTITATGGNRLSFHEFGHPSSSLSFAHLFPGFLGTATGMRPKSGHISAVALGEQSKTALGRDVWAMVTTRIQKWNMSVEGWEELILEKDLAEVISHALKDKFVAAAENMAALDLELLDLKMENSNTLVILASFQASVDESTMDIDMELRRVYAIVRMVNALNEEQFSVESVKSVPYQTTSTSIPILHPRLHLLSGGKLFIVQFSDAVAFCARDSDYMDRLELKSETDRTLGIGAVEKETDLLMLTATTMIKVEVHMEKVVSFSQMTGRADLIQSIMKQAILYGSYSENPLQFSFPPEIDEDALMMGAQQLSRAVLKSDGKIVRPHPDLQTQIAGRKERLIFLNKFIIDNGVMDKMSQRSRQQLETDAEKLYAADQLWRQHTEFWKAGRTRNVLDMAINACMIEIGADTRGDYVREFFRVHVEKIPSLIPHVQRIIGRSIRENRRNLADEIYQANEIALIILLSAVEYRQHNVAVYGVEPPLINPWSSSPEIIDAVCELFYSTARLAEVPSADPETMQSISDAKDQLPDLASVLFGCIQERLLWLRSPYTKDSDVSAERERLTLEEKFRQLRSQVFDILRRNGFTGMAFGLAEEYQDFRSLASLCNMGTVYPPEENPYAARIEAYIMKFKEQFATELYEWYIEHGELRTLFARRHDEYLDAFFASHPHPSISWIHDLGRGRYDYASKALLLESERTVNLEERHFILSVGKLSQLAQLHAANGSVDIDAIETFHIGLDFVGVHEALLEEFKAALAASGSRLPLDAQVKSISDSRAHHLQHYWGHRQLFKHLVRELLNGKALSPDDLAELVSLKDNSRSPRDYAIALGVLLRATNVPDARRLSTFRNVWRRIYLHDDWEKLRRTINLTDAEVNAQYRSTALYAALQTTIGQQQKPKGLILSPSEATEISAMSDITIRWPVLSPPDAERLYNEYQQERQRLLDLNLEMVFENVRQLVLDDENQMDSA
ncbi:uncharacterized protein LAESUDRAFT_646564 [Laetiporus sulphureus 93-53]|uniref:Uncharacterized protein n=1 Tax=Laetiporus sulphureus 93-53 TaxID=1314785 RepID=A0A165FW71_9APHY|nr:uncharacterized protein LAESUDRAFT_646564 [Laetiporus sulphureus 93-53]KZT09491.1 hypothetical protein LAESUDRAFT_646564 [Laetiporus sulphureus 93-53]